MLQTCQIGMQFYYCSLSISLLIWDFLLNLEHFSSNVACNTNNGQVHLIWRKLCWAARLRRFFEDLRSSVRFGALFQQCRNGQTHLILRKVYWAARRRRFFLKICDLRSELEHFSSNVGMVKPIYLFNFEESILSWKFAVFGRIWSTFSALFMY